MKNTFKLLTLSAIIVLVSYLLSCNNSLPKQHENKESANKYKRDETYSISILKEERIPIFDPPTDEQKRDFIKSGDYQSFSAIEDAYFYEDIYEEGIVYAFIAANKYNIPEANISVYNFLTGFGGNADVGKRTEDIIKHYLKRNAGTRDEEAKCRLKDIEMYGLGYKEYSDKREKVDYVPSAKSNGLVDIKKNVFKGSVKHYIALKDIFSKSHHPEEFLCYAILMANKFDYVPANYDVYEIFVDLYSKYNWGAMDKETYRLIISFLEYGSQKGDIRATREVQKKNKYA